MSAKTKVWKSITLGESKKSLEKKLKDYKVGTYAQDLFDKMEISKKQEVDLVILTPAKLGFVEMPTTTELFAEAKEQGYDLCPADVGPVLRVNYSDQPMGEWLYIAMEPITDSDGDPDVFRVGRRGGELWLGGGWAGPDDRWSLDYRVVFRMSSKNVEREQRPLMDRIFDKVDKTDHCWNWTGALRKGYGRVRRGKRGDGVLSVHRVVYETLVASVPKGRMLDHLCRNRACVNPDHMEVVTNAENVRRGIEYKNNLRNRSDLDLGSSDSPQSLEFLDSAIKICKENGLLVYKPL